jgi:hypothetical protein
MSAKAYNIDDLTPERFRAAMKLVSLLFNHGFPIRRIEAILRFVASARSLLPIRGAYSELSRHERLWASSIVLAALVFFEDESEREALLLYLGTRNAVTEVLTAWRIQLRPTLVAVS